MLHVYVHIYACFKVFCNKYVCVQCMWINTYIHSFMHYCGMFVLYFTVFPTAQWETAGSTVTDARSGFGVVIPCNPPPTAVPTPTVIWESRATSAGDDTYAAIAIAPLTNDDPNMRFRLTPEGDLIIHKLVSADFDQTYRCSVTNANVHKTVASGWTHTLNAGTYVMFEVCLQNGARAVCITFN